MKKLPLLFMSMVIAASAMENDQNNFLKEGQEFINYAKKALRKIAPKEDLVLSEQQVKNYLNSIAKEKDGEERLSKLKDNFEETIKHLKVPEKKLRMGPSALRLEYS